MVDPVKYFPGVKFERQPSILVSYEFNHATRGTMITALECCAELQLKTIPGAMIPEIQAAAENNAESTFSLEDLAPSDGSDYWFADLVRAIANYQPIKR